MYKIEDFAMMEPMKYYDNAEPKTVTLKKKWQDIVDNVNKDYVATVKNDGDWAMLIHYGKDNNLIRSRSISKVTGVYGDYTAKLPHIVEEMQKWPDNTVVLAEICWGEANTNANTVGTILRCLPAKAIERQKEKKLKAIIFDFLMVDGKDLTQEGYLERFLKDFSFLNSNIYIYKTDIFYDDFAEHADEIIQAGGEGLVLQHKDNPYMPGTRTAWKTLKLKKTLPHMELKVLGTLEPNKIYEGDCEETWSYWEGYYNDNPEHKYILERQITSDDRESTMTWTAVTKPYAKRWKNGIIVDYNGTKVSVTSGLTDADREWLATDEAKSMIEKGDLYAVIKAMSENDLGSLRHPSLIRLRNDM